MGNWSETERLRRDIARFWKNTRVEGTCIIWTGATSGPYGKFTTTVYPRVPTTHWVHRWIYQTCVGAIPADFVIRHACDTPLCVKIQHLDMGTQAQNIQDRINRGRPNSCQKLSEEQVKEIKRLLALGQSHKEIATLFGVATRTISGINTGDIWERIK